MDNAEEKGHNTTPGTRVDKDSIYPNPETASEPATQSIQAAENDEESPKTSQQAKMAFYRIIYFYINTNNDMDILFSILLRQ